METNAFELLGLPVKLAVSDDAIRDAFRQKAAVAHPDSGGDEQEFAALQGAQGILLSPTKRLKEWVRAKGLEAEARGQIEGRLMDLFQKVSETGAGAEAVIRENAAAQSSLAKAMVAVKLIKQRELIQPLIEEVETGIQERLEAFPKIEASEIDAGKVMRDLAFLEKWRATLRGIYGRLM